MTSESDSNPFNLSPAMEFQSKVQGWRERAARGELTQDEMREAIRLLREMRGALPSPGASSSSSGSGSKRKPKPAIDGQALLDELGI